mmetsp:Transcript_1547/g.3782  ORF Transcript_1547/g.3782 Transcript_1547/m.3782 type:complete len:210 (-) Transcript_1547:166-795(-)
MVAHAIRLVARPQALIPLPQRLPLHDPIPTLDILRPLPVVLISVCVMHGAVARFHVGMPVPLVPVLPLCIKGKRALSVPHSMLPLPFIHRRGVTETHAPMPMALPAQHIPLIAGAARPTVHPMACDVILMEGTLIDHVVREGEPAGAMQLAILDLPLIAASTLHIKLGMSTQSRGLLQVFQLTAIDVGCVESHLQKLLLHDYRCQSVSA